MHKFAREVGRQKTSGPMVVGVGRCGEDLTAFGHIVCVCVEFSLARPKHKSRCYARMSISVGRICTYIVLSTYVALRS